MPQLVGLLNSERWFTRPSVCDEQYRIRRSIPTAVGVGKDFIDDLVNGQISPRPPAYIGHMVYGLDQLLLCGI